MNTLRKIKKMLAVLLCLLIAVTAVRFDFINVQATNQSRDVNDRLEEQNDSTVTGGNARADEAGGISGRRKASESADAAASYQITVSAGDGGEAELQDGAGSQMGDNASVSGGDPITVVAKPDTGYEVVDVEAKKDSAEWTPADEGEDWWKGYISEEEGELGWFQFPIENVDGNYHFDVDFDKKQFTISYTLSEKGKLTLNSGAQDEKDKVILEAQDVRVGEETIAYTDAEYEIAAGVTDTDYHLTSFQVDGAEKISQNEAANGLHEKKYTFQGITGDHTIEVTAEIDTHNVSADVTGVGTVMWKNTDISVQPAAAPTKEEVALTVRPGAEEGTEYQVGSIKVNGTQIDRSGCTDNRDGSYTYTISAITEDTKVEVEFTEIPVSDKAFSELGIVMTDANGNPLTWNAENTCYANGVKLEAQNGEMRFSTDTEYASSVSLDATQMLEEAYLRDTSGFGTEEKIRFTAPVSFVIDKEQPKVALTGENPIYKAGTADAADIAGVLTDENPDRIVWAANQPLDETAILGETVNVFTGFSEADGSFILKNLPLTEGKDTDVFYVYGVDKAGNCSQACTVTVMRDGTAPEITKLELLPETIHSYLFGNYYHTELQLKLTAGDINEVNGISVPASGIKSVRIYAGDRADYYEGITEVKPGADAAVISITLPVGTKEKFAVFGEVRLVAADAMGNLSEEYRLTEILDRPAQIVNDGLMLEKDAPTVTAGAKADYIQMEAGEERHWYGKRPEVDYTVSDETTGADGSPKPGSGIAERKAVLNETEEITALTKTDYADAVTDAAGTLQRESGTVSSGDLAAMMPGKNTLKLQFRDFAGNEGVHEEILYLDNHAPEITGFVIEEIREPKDFLKNIFSFGNYTNTSVKIIVSGEDALDGSGTAIPSSGLKDITLYLDGIPYETKAAAEGSAEFILPAEAVLQTEEKIYLDKTITAMARDHVNHESAVCDMTTGNSNLESSDLMIETVKPRVEITMQADSAVQRNGKIYHNSDTVFDIKAVDAESGLRSIRAQINDTVLIDEKVEGNQKQLLREYTISTAEAAATEENLYVLTITVVDNAGNEYVAERQVYQDETNPEILRYEMEAAGVQEADGAEMSYETTDYGYYFREDTKVTVYADDGIREGDSGVKEIRYYTVDEAGVKSNITVLAADEEGKISFIIPAGFKGQIYACSYDWLLNSTERYLTPDSIIVETAEQHEAEEHIFFQKGDAPFRDINGRELYAGDVSVNLTVADTFSGIRKVEWSIEAPYDAAANQGGTLEIDNAGEFAEGSNGDGWTRTGRERNLVTELQRTVNVGANSNDIKVRVTMTDRAGNSSAQEIMFSIDRTSPVIEITFDNMTPDGQYTELFRQDRAATVTVTERNFNGADFAVNITNTDGTIPGISEWSTTVNVDNPDQTKSTATVIFSADGDYTFEISGRDRAGNGAQTVTAPKFTIDKTLPVITVSYDNENALNGNYYAAQRTATLQIEEHNFAPERVTVNGTATDNGNTIAFPGVGAWSHNGDVHTATIYCGEDGLYRFDVQYADMAGNEGEAYTGQEYYVDMTVPEIEITGVKDMSANNGDVIPQVILSDTNYDVNGVTLELTGANRGDVRPEGSYTSQGNGQIFTFNNFPVEQPYDDIYTLTATLTDMAGNESAQTITFSVNRFGSVYVLDESLKAIEGSYIQEEIDVKLTEVNVDSLEHDKIRVVVDANGTPRDLTEGTDYTVEETGGNGNWYQYAYTIDKSLFAGDGRYIVTLYSEDVAGNINENAAASKKAEISFGVDKTAPVVIPIDIESDAQYAVDVKTATVAVNDNLVLDNVEVYVGGERCGYEADGENYTFEVPGSTVRQDVSVQAVDAAGNRTNYVISGVLVTTNAFIRWYNNTPLFVGTLAGAAVVSGGGVGLAAAFKSGRIRLKKKK